ncbi:MAG: hypothetical protein HZB26_13185 [Candidatus Hydrogenedentes bacterium]|nr:hypothetical protein [Candidatus Hydrogenedentota bacterium]
MRRFTLLQIVLVSSVFTQAVSAAETTNAAAAPHSEGLRVVIIDGVNKDPEEIRSKDKNVMRLARYFRDTIGVPAQSLFVLTQADSFVGERTGASDAATIKSVLTALAKQPSKGTTIIYYTGQANLVGDQLRFNIPGPDITHEEFGALIKAFGEAPLCVVLDCPGAGHAVKALAGPNRIVVCAARSDQPTSTRFSDYFVPALTDTKADINGDGHISLLEAFQLTVQQIDAAFRDRSLMKSETALLDDNGDGVPSQRPWVSGEEEKDGEWASRLYTDTWKMAATIQQKSEAEAETSATAGKP